MGSAKGRTVQLGPQDLFFLPVEQFHPIFADAPSGSGCTPLRGRCRVVLSKAVVSWRWLCTKSGARRPTSSRAGVAASSRLWSR